MDALILYANQESKWPINKKEMHPSVPGHLLKPLERE